MKIRKYVLGALLTLLCVVALASRTNVELTPTGTTGTSSTGISAEAMTTNTTDAIPVRNVNQLFLGVSITPTNDGTVKATCQITPDGTNWYKIQDCLYGGSGNYNCSEWSDTFTVVSGTASHVALLVPVYGKQAKCTFAATTATGTITVRGEGSEQ